MEEYFFAKLASCLKIGPKVVPLFGYDILIHENSFEFVMEYCEGGIIDKERMKQDLMENLKIMHSLGIVHLDIKPENISWSNKFKKWIFLDFGFARYLDTKIGYKTETNFIGTFNYASKAMKQLYYLQKKGFVDLYYNDLFSLEKSLKNIQNHQTAKTKNYPSFNIKEKSKTTIFLNSVLAFVKIKFDFSRKNYR